MEEKSQNLHLDFWPKKLDRWGFLSEKGLCWRRSHLVDVNGSQGGWQWFCFGHVKVPFTYLSRDVE